MKKQESTFGSLVQCRCSSYCATTSAQFQWQFPEVKKAHMMMEDDGI